jgi:uncharacterized protein YcaQ
VEPRPVQLKHARRLFITQQRLAGPRPSADREGILDTVRSIRCLQLDPTSAVARSHLLVLWSRIGRYDPAILERLAYEERMLFEFWAHQASLVLSEDFSIHQWAMRTDIKSDAAWRERTREWIKANDKLKRHILTELKKRGPLRARDIEDVTDEPWHSSGWTNERNVGRMFDLLSVQGKALVSRREGGQKLWDLGERCLPPDRDRTKLPTREVVRSATRLALHALGVAKIPHIREHFTRGRYPDLPKVLEQMVGAGEVIPIELLDGKSPLRGPWFVDADDLEKLEAIEDGGWQPRTSLLSPFDNLICGRDRTEEMFDFRFRLEIYTPKDKRQYGFFVLPILHGDRLIGRIDPTVDRKNKAMTVNAIHLEPGAPASRTTANKVRRVIEDLARFVGVDSIEYAKVPPAWAASFRS